MFRSRVVVALTGVWFTSERDKAALRARFVFMHGKVYTGFAGRGGAPRSNQPLSNTCMLSSPECRTNCESRGRRINPFETEAARSGQRKTRVTSYHPLSHNHLYVRTYASSSGLINPCTAYVFFPFFPGRVLYLWNKLADISVVVTN